ncbi:MAG TPA: type II toxin-antitoxin system Phd/YefM family antitoxin [Pseudolysinimonas sp.]|nr:type II toxin-antitoxin system Phd/YefM family antitoxin [Pseudolysinimonas sp.]
MATINVFDAKAQFSKLIARAEAGEEIVISRHGREVARLVPMPTAQADRSPGWVKAFDVPDDFDDWTETDEQDWFG